MKRTRENRIGLLAMHDSGCCKQEFRAVLWAGSLALAVLPLLSGCVNAPQGVAMIQATEQDDIPAPANFAFDAERSYVYDPVTVSDSKFRSWRGFYRGEGDTGRLLSWYVGEMPKHGWKFKGLDDKAKKLYFDKGDESAEIQVYEKLEAAVGGYVTTVEAAVRPRGPEDLTLEENLQQIRGSSVEPGTFKEAPGEAEPRPAAAQGETVNPSEDPSERAPSGASGKPLKSKQLKSLPAEESARPDPADVLEEVGAAEREPRSP
jgi:hypothetical protein